MKVSYGAAVAILCGLLVGGSAFAAVTPEEAAKLNSVLTPFGGEKAGNKDGSIPAWTGGDTTAPVGFVNGGRRSDMFAGEKPLYSITAKTLGQYGALLSDGVKAMFAKYPDSYRIDVYPTHRTAAAPQWVYDNTFKNATQAKLIEAASGLMPTGAYGGIPFPIPKNGTEVIWNHLLRWRAVDWHFDMHGILSTADGKRVLVTDGRGDQTMPYYYRDQSPEAWNGMYWMVRLINAGPPIRAGEAIIGTQHIDDDKTNSWVYLTGQRRVRKLPNSCCDTPTPATAGVMSFDEAEVFNGRTGRFDWKLLGKKEMLIPYNTNRSLQPTSDDALIGEHHLNPDHVRWEKHRVWVIEASLKAGMRHLAPRGVYYVDEDSWIAVLGDRWDAKGQLWKTMWSLPVNMPDIPAVGAMTFGFYDLISGAGYANNVYNEKNEQFKITPRYSPMIFTPDALSGEGVR